MDTKESIRVHKLERRDQLEASQCTRWSQEISRHLRRYMERDGADTVMVYSAIRNEVDLSGLHEELRRQGRSLVYPRADTDRGTLRLYRVKHPEEQLVPGAYGLDEPDPARASPISPDRVDLVLVPGVAFDERGYRIGYGGGYYDRLLATLEPGTRTVGVCYHFQLCPELPIEDHDEPVQRIVTEEGLTGSLEGDAPN